MTLPMLAFAAGLTLALAALAARGDYRDKWAGAVIVIQTVLVWWQIANLVAIALIYLMAAVTFLVFSIRKSGALLGVVSGMMCILTVFAANGWMPTERGQGIAYNYYQWCTVIAWGQVGILGFMANDWRNILGPGS